MTQSHFLEILSVFGFCLSYLFLGLLLTLLATLFWSLSLLPHIYQTSKHLSSQIYTLFLSVLTCLVTPPHYLHISTKLSSDYQKGCPGPHYLKETSIPIPSCSVLLLSSAAGVGLFFFLVTSLFFILTLSPPSCESFQNIISQTAVIYY